jgi:CheY-like chemotaxis protein
LKEFCIIIDDDPISILVCETVLKKTDFAKKAQSFQSAEEALVFLKKLIEDGEDLPDFIFLDVMMPNMDGWAFLDEYAKLIKQPFKPHILMLTAVFEEAQRTRAKENPLIFDFVSKPLTKDVLSEVGLS